MRTCKRNHKYEAELDDFGKNKGCPECRRITAKKFHEERKQAADFLEKHRNTQNKWYKKRGSSIEARLAQRANRLKTRYWPNLNMWQALAEYERLLAGQEYRCRICEVDQSQYDSAFHVDHCHKTGQVRGLLCMVCNRYIVGGIDIRAKSKKVVVDKKTIVDNIIKYFEDLDPEYRDMVLKRQKARG